MTGTVPVQSPPMEKDSVIVVYVPDRQPFIDQFYGLWYSLVGKTDLHQKFDLLVTGPESIKPRIPKQHCRFVAIPDLSSRPDFRYQYSGTSHGMPGGSCYGFVNSFAPFIDPQCVEIISDYKYCLRLDVDTFVCPGLQSIQCADDEIIVGMGFYSGPANRDDPAAVRPRLAEILKSRNLPDQNIHDIGSTWFAPSQIMIEAGAETIEYVKYLLGDHFSESIGFVPTSEPNWYGINCTLYAGHLVLNSSALEITKTDQLDFPSNWNHKEVTNLYTLHCWAGAPDFYSKRAYSAGKYVDRKPDDSSLKCSEYSYACISRGANHGAVLAFARTQVQNDG